MREIYEMTGNPDEPDEIGPDYARTYLNCAWAEARILNGPVWLDGWRSKRYCLALSGKAGEAVEVSPDRCATCPFWRARARADEARM